MTLVEHTFHEGFFMPRKQSTLDFIPTADAVREELERIQEKERQLSYLLQVSEELERRRDPDASTVDSAGATS